MATLGMVVPLQREAIAIALDRNDVNQALARQKALRSTMNNSPLWHLQLAELYWSAGRRERARQTLANLLNNLDRLNPALQRRAQALDRKITATGSG